MNLETLKRMKRNGISLVDLKPEEMAIVIICAVHPGLLELSNSVKWVPHTGGAVNPMYVYKLSEAGYVYCLETLVKGYEDET